MENNFKPKASVKPVAMKSGKLFMSALKFLDDEIQAYVAGNSDITPESICKKIDELGGNLNVLTKIQYANYLEHMIYIQGKNLDRSVLSRAETYVRFLFPTYMSTLPNGELLNQQPADLRKYINDVALTEMKEYLGGHIEINEVDWDIFAEDFEKLGIAMPGTEPELEYVEEDNESQSIDSIIAGFEEEDIDDPMDDLGKTPEELAGVKPKEEVVKPEPYNMWSVLEEYESPKEAEKEEVVEEELNPVAVERLMEGLPEEEKEEILEEIKEEPKEIDDDIIRLVEPTAPEKKEIEVTVEVIEPTLENLNKYMPIIETNPDAKILRNLSGSKIDRIKAYKESAKFGRRMFLPDGGYDVFVKRCHDKYQINYMYSLVAEYASIEEKDFFVKDELIRIIYDHLEFYFVEEPTLMDFTSSISQRDLNLIAIMFATVNAMPDKNKKPSIEVSNCRCSNCRSIEAITGGYDVDLEKAFIETYPLNTFMKRYRKYKNNTYERIQDAFREKGNYGQVYLVKGEDEAGMYRIILSNPTVYKSQNVRGNMKKVYYDMFRRGLKDRYQYISKEMDVDAVNKIVNIDCADYSDFNQKLIKLNSDANANAVDKKHYNDVSNLLSEFKNNYALNGFFEMSRYIDTIKFIPKGLPEEEAKEMTITLDHTDLYGMVDIMNTTMPNEIFTKVYETVDKLAEELKETDTILSIESKDVCSKFDWEKIYPGEDEYVKNLLDETPTMSETELTKLKDERKELIKKLNDDGSCPLCGATSPTYEITYDQVLFFSAVTRLA